MNKAVRRNILLALVLMAAWSMYGPAAADDDHEDGHREKTESHQRHEEGKNRARNLKPVDSPAYLEACGACHFAYQPELLPAASWEKILSGLNDHFGETVELDDNAKQAIGVYLKSNCAETSAAELAVKMLGSLEGAAPVRVTDVFYIRKKHHGIPADVFKGEPVGSFSNCAACHPGAVGGVYDEDSVRIPR